MQTLLLKGLRAAAERCRPLLCAGHATGAQPALLLAAAVWASEAPVSPREAPPGQAAPGAGVEALPPFPPPSPRPLPSVPTSLFPA